MSQLASQLVRASNCSELTKAGGSYVSTMANGRACVLLRGGALLSSSFLCPAGVWVLDPPVFKEILDI